MKSNIILICCFICLRSFSFEGFADEESYTDKSKPFVTGYEYIEKQDIIFLLHGNKWAHINRPTKADLEYAAKLPDEIKSKAIEYIGKPKKSLGFFAARVYGDILILDISPSGIDDGNFHLLYDLKKKTIIGRCIWYVQG